MAETKKQTAAWYMDAQESNKGVIVKLYSDHDQVVHPVVKLYDTDLSDPTQDLTKIPATLLKEMQLHGISDNMSDPIKSVAQSKGWLTKIDPPIDFFVEVHDGKTSKRVDWEATEAAWAGGGPAGSAGNASGDVYEGLTERHLELLAKVGEETFEIGKQAMLVVNNLEESTGASGINADDLFKLAFYRISKMFDSVRGAWVVPAEGAIPNPFDIIKDGTIETFAGDLAAGHYLINDEDTVRKLIDMLDIKVTKQHADDVNKRVEVAQKVWMFVDLTEKYGQKPSEAKVVIDELFDQVPW